MDLRRFWHPRTLLALGALALTVVIVACGGAGHHAGGDYRRLLDRRWHAAAGCRGNPHAEPLRRRGGADTDRAAGRGPNSSAGAYRRRGG